MSTSLRSLTTVVLAQAAAAGDTASHDELRRRLAAREANPSKANGSIANARITERLRKAIANPAAYLEGHMTAPDANAASTWLGGQATGNAKAAPSPVVAFTRTTEQKPVLKRDSLKAVRTEMDARFSRMDATLNQMAATLVQLARRQA